MFGIGRCEELSERTGLTDEVCCLRIERYTESLQWAVSSSADYNQSHTTQLSSAHRQTETL